MRLIDADNISNVREFVKLDKNGNAYVSLDDLCTIIDIQPTAYDIDDVVKELEETHKRFCNSVVCGGRGNSYLCEDCEEYILVSHYIKAVKDGRTCQ